MDIRGTKTQENLLRAFNVESEAKNKYEIYAAKAKKGKRFIYFPEGKYEHNGNKLQDFRPGSFKCSKLAECPIVPVAIYDSHLPFDFNSLRKATTQVYFLEPIFFSEYAEKTTKEISIMVKERIEEKIQFLEENRRRLNLNSHFKIYKQQM